MSLKNVLKPEYRFVLQLNAATTVNQFLDNYLEKNKYTERFQKKWGERYIGEITPKLLQDQKIWDTEVSPNKLSPEALYALRDKDFQNVLKKVEPDYKIDLNHVKAGDLARLAMVQHLGMAHQLAHKKKDEIGHFIDTLNDPLAYNSVKNNIKRIFPDFSDYLPKEPYQFKLMAYEKNIVKEIDSSWRKADDYQPKKDNFGRAGVFGIKDPLRITIVPKSCENLTWEDWTRQRNQFFAFAIAGNLGMDIQFIKDHINKASLAPHKKLHWPCCMFHGKQFYKLDEKETSNVYVGLSQEIQFAPLGPKNEHYKDTTAAIRKNARKNKKNRIEDGSSEAQTELTREMMKKTLSHLLDGIENQKPDPSYTMILQFMSDQKQITSKKPSKNMVNLSDSNSLREIGSNIPTQHALKEMIQPYTAKKLKTLNS